MKENIMSPELRRVFPCVVLLVSLAIQAPLVLAQTGARNNTAAETNAGASTSAPRSAAVNPKYTTPKSALDTAYGAKIAEFTTEKYFMTELVAHLPLSDKVPSPEKVLGYAIG